MRCFVCDKELEPAMGKKKLSSMSYEFQPYAGTSFYTWGHFGSTVFDPSDRSSLELFICDPCLRERKHRIVHRHQMSRVDTIYMPFDPGPPPDDD